MANVARFASLNMHLLLSLLAKLSNVYVVISPSDGTYIYNHMTDFDKK